MAELPRPLWTRAELIAMKRCPECAWDPPMTSWSAVSGARYRSGVGNIIGPPGMGSRGGGLVIGGRHTATAMIGSTPSRGNGFGMIAIRDTGDYEGHHRVTDHDPRNGAAIPGWSPGWCFACHQPRDLGCEGPCQMLPTR